jgi:hypothetical protein
MELSLHESGKMIGLEYGSPEGSAEFVTWVLNRFPAPDDVTAQLFEWGPPPQGHPSDDRPRPARHRPPDNSVHHLYCRRSCRSAPPLMDGAATASIATRHPRADNAH